jgi:hypothetical protein
MPNTDINPQQGVQGSSYLYTFGTTANTRTAVSQKVRILAPAYGNNSALFQVGVLSTFDPSESKTVEPVRGIGFGDHVAEQVPSVTDPMECSVERALLYLANLWQATGYAAGIDGPVRSLKHHRWPFDVEQQLVFSTLADNDLESAGTGFNGTSGAFNGGVKAIQFPTVTEINGISTGGHTAIITMYETCWWTAWSTSFAKDAGMIMESGTITTTDVHDFSSIYGEFLATGNDPTIGQLGSIRFGNAAGVIGGGGLG